MLQATVHQAEPLSWHDIGFQFLMNRISILILDDVPYVRRLIADELSSLGEVGMIYEAGSAPAAVRTLVEHRPEIIILDINVPGGVVDTANYSSGIDVLQFAKSQLPDSTVIILSNNSNQYYRRECKKAGVDLFFDKTTEFDLFLEQIQGEINRTAYWFTVEELAESSSDSRRE